LDTSATYSLLESSSWRDYALLDSGNGQKLERFGAYTLVRPEGQAMWSPALPRSEWSGAHAHFKPTGEESGGHWDIRRQLPEKWEMTYPLRAAAGRDAASLTTLRFSVMTTPGRHLGVFPEAAVHWDYAAESIASSDHPVKVLNLFGYTGLASLACAAAGAAVTHVDASKKSVTWARQNQSLSQLDDKPVRWIVDDALKFVQREVRREARYDGIIIEPPKFGRGPKGEVWEIYKSLPDLMHACKQLISPHPAFMILTVYAVRASAVHLGQLLQDVVRGLPRGSFEEGELVTREQQAKRLLSQAVFARWRSD
jgi:23S rRNA (cytosine1962-C5)-methyltransferase